jgi:hypothetical protein
MGPASRLPDLGPLGSRGYKSQIPNICCSCVLLAEGTGAQGDGPACLLPRDFPTRPSFVPTLAAFCVALHTTHCSFAVVIILSSRSTLNYSPALPSTINLPLTSFPPSVVDFHQQSKKFAAMSSSKAISGSITNSGIRTVLLVYFNCMNIR